MRLDQIQFRPGFLEHVLPVLLERGIGEHGFDIADIGHPDHGGTADLELSVARKTRREHSMMVRATETSL